MKAKAALSVHAYFEAVHLPTFLCLAAPNTILEYRYTLGLWDRAVGCVAIAEVDTLVLAEFRSRLMDGRAVATVNKHLRHVGAILGKAGQPGPSNRDALGIIARVPWVKPLREFDRLPHVVSIETIGKVYEACRWAINPQLAAVRASDWWRALLVLACTSGFRRGALLSLRWKNIDVGAGLIRVDAEAQRAGRPVCQCGDAPRVADQDDRFPLLNVLPPHQFADQHAIGGRLEFELE